MGFFDALFDAGKSMVSAAEEKSKELISTNWEQMKSFNSERLKSFIQAKGATNTLSKIALLRLYEIDHYSFRHFMNDEQVRASIIQFCKSNPVQMNTHRNADEFIRVANRIISELS